MDSDDDTLSEMGELEGSAQDKRRKDYLQRAVLSAVALTGILAVAVVAPNVLQLLGGTTRGKSRFTYQTKSVLSRLAAKGYIRFIGHNGKKSVEITAAGRRAAEIEAHSMELRTHRPKRWDKRWRLVMFDIPERRKKERDRLRHMMIDAGFLCFQDSVWIFPYDCEDLVALLKIDMHLGNAVRYAIVETLENDAAVKKHFGLH